MLAQRPLLLTPLLNARIGNALLGLIPAGVLVGVLTDPPSALDATGWLLVTAVSTAGTVLAIRGYRMGVLVTTTTVVVRGLFRTRTIQRSTVVDVSDFPAIRWRTADGRLRRSPLLAFSSGGSKSIFSSQVEDHRQWCLRLLRKTLRGRRPRYR